MKRRTRKPTSKKVLISDLKKKLFKLSKEAGCSTEQSEARWRELSINRNENEECPHQSIELRNMLLVFKHRLLEGCSHSQAIIAFLNESFSEKQEIIDLGIKYKKLSEEAYSTGNTLNFGAFMESFLKEPYIMQDGYFMFRTGLIFLQYIGGDLAKYFQYLLDLENYKD